MNANERKLTRFFNYFIVEYWCSEKKLKKHFLISRIYTSHNKALLRPGLLIERFKALAEKMQVGELAYICVHLRSFIPRVLRSTPSGPHSGAFKTLLRFSAFSSAFVFYRHG